MDPGRAQGLAEEDRRQDPVKRVFVDANLLFSAAHSPLGRAAIFVEEARLQGFHCLTSEYAVGETRRNLGLKSSKSLPAFEKILKLLHIEKMGHFSHVCEIKLRDKDQPIYLAALECKADILLTGDYKDFGPYMNAPKKTQGLRICTVADLQNERR